MAVILHITPFMNLLFWSVNMAPAPKRGQRKKSHTKHLVRGRIDGWFQSGLQISSHMLPSFKRKELGGKTSVGRRG